MSSSPASSYAPPSSASSAREEGAVTNVSKIDFKNALMVFYVIMTASFFDKFFSCDLQRLLTHNIIAKHVVAIVSVFFVITLVTESDGETTILQAAVTTLVIYAIYIATTKAKLAFVLPMVLFLLIDQLLAVYERYDLGKLPDDAPAKRRVARVRTVLTYVIAALIAGGIAHYLFRAVRDFGSEFSVAKFLLGTYNCKGLDD